MKTFAKKSFAVVLAMLMALSALTVGSISAFAGDVIPAAQIPVGTETAVTVRGNFAYYAFQAPQAGTYAVKVAADNDSKVGVYPRPLNTDGDYDLNDSVSGMVNFVWNNELKEVYNYTPSVDFITLAAGDFGYIKAWVDEDATNASISVSMTETEFMYNYTRVYDELTYNETDYDGTVYTQTEECMVGFGVDVHNYCGASTVVVVPQMIDGYNVTEVSNFASFPMDKNIVSVTLPETIKAINGDAFEGMYSLKSINIPASVERIGGYAFSGCKALSGRLYIGENIEYVGSHAFFDTGFDSVYVAGKKTVVDDYAFGYKRVLEETTVDPSDTTFAIDANFIIIGPANSYAQKYAVNNGIAFYDAFNCAHCYVTTASTAATLFKTGSTTEVCRACGSVKKTTVAKKKIAVKSLKAKKKAFVVKAAKQSGITGYQIQYSTSKKFTKKTTKSVKVKTTKALSKTVKGLKSGKKYYVRVRAYKVSGKKTTYGVYGAAKSVKVK